MNIVIIIKVINNIIILYVHMYAKKNFKIPKLIEWSDDKIDCC